MVEMTNAQLMSEVDTLTEKVRQMENLLALFMVNGLQDAFDGTGNQSFGGGLMNLGKKGQQVRALSVGDTIKAFFFVQKIVADPTAETRYSWIDGYVGTGETGIALNATDGSTTARLSLFANAGLTASHIRINPALRLENLTADPAFLIDGMMWYRSDTDTFHVYANSAIKTITIT